MSVINPKFNVIIEHFNFFQRKQEEFKSFDKLLRHIKTMAKRCNYCDPDDKTVKVRIVLEVRT